VDGISLFLLPFYEIDQIQTLAIGEHRGTGSINVAIACQVDSKSFSLSLFDTDQNQTLAISEQCVTGSINVPNVRWMVNLFSFSLAVREYCITGYINVVNACQVDGRSLFLAVRET
jgi:hypothetical protein